MGAYVFGLSLACKACVSRATVEVFNTFNVSVGKFCKRHGDVALAELKRHEDQVVRAAMEERNLPPGDSDF